MSYPRKEPALKKGLAKVPKLRVTQHGTYRKTTDTLAPSGPKTYAMLRIVNK